MYASFFFILSILTPLLSFSSTTYALLLYNVCSSLPSSLHPFDPFLSSLILVKNKKKKKIKKKKQGDLKVCANRI